MAHYFINMAGNADTLMSADDSERSVLLRAPEACSFRIISRAIKLVFQNYNKTSVLDGKVSDQMSMLLLPPLVKKRIATIAPVDQI